MNKLETQSTFQKWKENHIKASISLKMTSSGIESAHWMCERTDSYNWCMCRMCSKFIRFFYKQICYKAMLAATSPALGQIRNLQTVLASKSFDRQCWRKNGSNSIFWWLFVLAVANNGSRLLPLFRRMSREYERWPPENIFKGAKSEFSHRIFTFYQVFFIYRIILSLFFL